MEIQQTEIDAHDRQSTMGSQYQYSTTIHSNNGNKRRRRKCFSHNTSIVNVGVMLIALILQHSFLNSMAQNYPWRTPVSTPTVRTSSSGSGGSYNAAEQTTNGTLDTYTDFPSAFPSAIPTAGNYSFSTTQTTTFQPTSLPSITTGTPTASPTLRNTTTSPPNTTTSPPITNSTTSSPSRKPIKTRSPTRRPTRRNSTGTVSAKPSSAPTYKSQKQIVKVYMLLTNMSAKLSKDAEMDFTDAMSAHIKTSIEDKNPEVKLSSVETIMDNQRFTARRLQQQGNTKAPLQTTVNVVITFSSAEPASTVIVNEWVRESFNSNVDREAFIDRLQRNDEFKDVVRVDTRVGGDDIPTSPPIEIPPIEEPRQVKDNSRLWIIVGASAVGFVVLLLLILLLVKRGKRNANIQKNSHKMSEGRTSIAETTKGMGYAAEINVDRQDDISTLGDPVYGGPVGGMIMDEMEPRDEFTASIGPDYDYTRRLGASSRTDSMGTNTLHNELGSHDQTARASDGTSFSKNGQPLGSGPYDDEEDDDEDDDVSFEEQFASNTRRTESQDRFEVEVPPGKLGMVIDTPNNGVPVVHAIKQESVLCDRVYVGDRLVSVDGEDVTSMTAVQVSKLISLKSDQRRMLVFLRSKEINGSQDDFY